MSDKPPATTGHEIWQEVLGYLNFSSGASDPRFLANLNELFGQIEAAGTPPGESAYVLKRRLVEKLAEFAGRSAAFADVEQARAAIRLIFDVALPAYREHHRDLLFHLSDADLLRPFFIGRVAEAVLAAAHGLVNASPSPAKGEGRRAASPERAGGGSGRETEGAAAIRTGDDTDRIVTDALVRLNDFIGHRPVAVLHTDQKIEPYPHERVRPIPIYVAGAGISVGRYRAVAALALDLLRSTDRSLLEDAWFDPDLLDELAIDPRAYDFDHPVNKRPNYHFGQWDPHHLDRQGRYRRFVLQQVALDAVMERVEAAGPLPRDELLFEAAAVLAGIILMASGTSGDSPQAHDSSATLGTLLPQIAAYRDAFYQQLFDRLSGPHAERLRAERAALHQPFAAARQHLNAQLSRRRALQMQHVHLALLFARLGFPDAAVRQVQIVPAASARIVCQVQCLITVAHRAAQRGRLTDGVACLAQIEDLLHRGIECGAIIDPWTILGFGGQFSLFPAVENSIPDHRVEELLELMERIFNVEARLWHLAAAGNDADVLAKLPGEFRMLAEWWDQFATSAVSGVRWVSGNETYAAAEKVAHALAAWHAAGASGGDVNFWRPHVDDFDSPQAYGWVIEVLLERRDLAAAMALLIHWLSQAERVRLDEGHHSFHVLALRWIQLALAQSTSGVPPHSQSRVADPSPPAPLPQGERGGRDAAARLTVRFFDLLEANAEEFWEVPQLQSAGQPRRPEPAGEDEELAATASDDPDDEDEGLYSAAYDEMVYRDSTADGVEGDMLESGSPPADSEWEAESNRITRRLAFLTTVARLWKEAARAHLERGTDSPAPADSFPQWMARANEDRQRLEQLAGDVARQPVPRPSAGQESMLEFDRRTNVKESLVERVIATWSALEEAKQFLAVAAERRDGGDAGATRGLGDAGTRGRGDTGGAPAEDDAVFQLWRAVLTADATAARSRWPQFLAAVRQQPLLYVRLARGGEPARIAAVRGMQQLFRELLRRLPRLGMLRETCQLIQTARSMERDHPLGPGAVTEFDRLFEIGFKAIIECVVESSESWPRPKEARAAESDESAADTELIDCLQHVTESLLPQWASHSHTLRLSALEKIASEKDWKELVDFIDRYGGDLFTQMFFNLGNLRAILHQGIDAWLDQLQADPEAHDELQLIADLDGRLPRAQARKHLSLVIEAVAENFAEYKDYNATTTQSDRGELLYTLLDFLRVKSLYERIHWNLRPVTMVHEVLVRRGHEAAARLWCRAMARETGPTADQQLRRLAALQKKYGMRLSTVSDRLAERFIRPLAIDRVRALVRPAADESRRETPARAFTALEAEASELAQEPTGAGLDLPDWLSALEEEVESAAGDPRTEHEADPVAQFLRVRLTWEEIQDQLSNWEIRRLEEKPE